eukprot:m.891929 g.891929  ORF g.891929 m.891929 type:complete len:470 (+) comp59969_c0_seq8:39-1448(+)
MAIGVWVSLVVGVCVMVCAGTPFMLAAFGQLLKNRFAYTQTEITMVQTSTQVGLYAGIVQGVVYDRFGVRVACALAMLLLCGAYLAVYLAANHTPPPPLLAALFFLIGQGSHGLYTVSTMTNVPNFKAKQRGRIMGLLAAAFGISGALFTALFQIITFPHGVPPPPPLNASTSCWLPSTLPQPSFSAATSASTGTYSTVLTSTSSASTWLSSTSTGSTQETSTSSSMHLRDVPQSLFESMHSMRRALRDFEAGSSTFTTTSSPTSTAPSLSGSQEPLYYFLVTTLLVFAFGVLALIFVKKYPIPEYLEDGLPLVDFTKPSADLDSETPVHEMETALMQEIESIQLIADESERPSDSPQALMLFTPRQPELDIHGLQILRNTDFWLLFVSMGIEDGTAVMFINSIGSMHESLQVEDEALPQNATLVILFALANCFGRISWGVISDFFEKNRPAVLLATMIGMLMTHILVT